MTALRVAAALASRWRWVLGGAAFVGALAWLGPKVAPLGIISGLSVACWVMLGDIDDVRAELDRERATHTECIAVKSRLAAELLDVTVNACPMCNARRHRERLAAKVERVS